MLCVSTGAILNKFGANCHLAGRLGNGPVGSVNIINSEDVIE